jgi:NADPH:quinone reductase-like Zn-dependent oxidoreductase
MDDLCAAISVTRLHFDDIIDQVFPFDKADKALDYIWQGKQIGKLIIQI